MTSPNTNKPEFADGRMAVPPLEGCRLIRIGLSHLYKLMREGKVK